MQYKPGCVTLTDLMSNMSSLVLTAIHAHTLSVQQRCTVTCTHTHADIKTKYPLWAAAITWGDSTHLTVPKSEKFRPFEQQTDLLRFYHQDMWSKEFHNMSFIVSRWLQTKQFCCTMYCISFSLSSWSHLAWRNVNKELLFICLCLWFFCSAAEETWFPKMIWATHSICTHEEMMLFAIKGKIGYKSAVC